MTKVYLVEAEHPFQGNVQRSLHQSPLTAEVRAAELTNEILDDFWPIFDDENAQPVVDRLSWEDAVEKYGDRDDFVQDEGWGRWYVAVVPLELQL